MYFLAGLLSLTLQTEEKEFNAEQILRSIKLDVIPFYQDEFDHVNDDEAAEDAFSVISEKSVIDLDSEPNKDETDVNAFSVISEKSVIDLDSESTCETSD